MVWQPTGTSNPTFTVVVKDDQGLQSVESFSGAVTSFNDWTATNALCVDVFPNAVVSQDAGKIAYIRVSLPDIVSDANLAVTIEKTDNAPEILNGPDASVIVVPASGNRMALLQIPIPAYAKLNDAYTIRIAATSGFGSNQRSGAAAVVVVCAGNPALFFDPIAVQTGSSGTVLQPQQLGVYYWQQLVTTPDITNPSALSPTPSSANSVKRYLNATEAPDLYVVGNEPGLFINQAMQLTGQLLRSLSAYAFKVAAVDVNYRWGFLDVTLNVQDVVDPIVFSSFTSSSPLVTTGAAFDLNWGYNVGAIGDFFLKRDQEIATEVQGTTVTEVMDADAIVYSLRGTNSINGVTEYFAPSVVVLLSDVAVTVLPPAPAVFTLDENFVVTASWQPKKINGGYLDYGVFNIWLDPTANPSVGLQHRSDGSLPTGSVVDGGTDDARRFHFIVNADSAAAPHVIDMQGLPSDTSTALESARWDSPKAFPVIGPVTVKTTALLNEPINISIDGTTVGTRWRVVFDDQNDPMWLKISQKVISKAFNVAGTHDFRIEVMNDFSSSYPSVKMVRTLTKSIYISDQQYQPPAGSDPAAGIIGLGGDAGYEITGLDPNVAVVPAPYAVFVKGLAKDEQTQELKLFIATARSRDGSSVLGTMAADVFPLPGRPHAKELMRRPYLVEDRGNIVDPVSITTTTLGAPIIVGKPMVPVQLTAEGGLPPYTWSAVGLPYGIHFTTDGTLSGTMLQAATNPIAFSVKDSSLPEYVDEKTLDLVSMSDLEIYKPATQILDNALTGVAYQTRIEARGGVPAYHHAIVFGSLPRGLSLNANTGYITGSPVAYSAADLQKTYTFVVETTDALNAKAQKHFDINLLAHPLTVTDPDNTNLYKGQDSRVRWTIFGGNPPYTISGITGVGTGLFKSDAVVTDGTVEVIGDANTALAPGSYAYVFTITDANGIQTQRSSMFQLHSKLGTYVMCGVAPSTLMTGADITFDIAADTTVGGYSFGLPNNITASNGVTLAGANRNGNYVVAVTGPTSPNANDAIARFQYQVLQGSRVVGKISRAFRFQNVLGDMSVSTPMVASITAPAQRLNWPMTLETLHGLVTKGLTASVQDMSALPSGVSIDPATGVIYGTPLDTLPSSVIEFKDFQQNLFGTATVLWNLYGSKITTTGDFDPATMWVPYSSSLPLNGATNYTSPQIVNGVLPEGLTATITTDTNGVKRLQIQGRPSEAGIFDVAFLVKDADALSNEGLIYARITSEYKDAIHFITDSIPDMIAGIPFKTGGRDGMALQVSGGTGNYTFAVVQPAPAGATSANLPTGIVLNPTTGVISGTPADQYTLSTFNELIAIRVTDDSGNTDQRIFRFIVKSAVPIVITTASVPDCVQGAQYPVNTYLQATGGAGAYRWAVTSDSPAQLPPGLTLTSTGVGAGLISGTPTAYGNFTVKFKVTDDRALVPDDQAGAGTNPKTLTFHIQNPTVLHLNAATMPNGMASLGYPIGGGSVAITAGGGVGPYAWAIQSQPSNMNAVVVGNGLNATLTAAPSAATSGNITIKITDSQGATATRDYPVLIVSQSAPQITNALLNGGQPNLPYSDIIKGVGGLPPYTFSIDPSSPTPLANVQALGLQLNGSTGAFNGTPSSAVSRDILFRITDAANLVSTKLLTLNIACAIAIDTTALQVQNTPSLTWRVNSTTNGLGNTSTQLQTSGNAGGVTWSGTNFPPGMTISSAGVISGRPTTVGAYQIHVNATDTVTGCTASAVGWLVVSASTLAITAPAAGTSYRGIPGGHALNNVTVSATGGAAPYHWSLSNSPSWINIDYNTGVLTDSGIPAPGVYQFTVMCTDSDGTTTTINYSIDATVNIRVASALGVVSATSFSSNSLGTYVTLNQAATSQIMYWLNQGWAFTVIAFGCNSAAPSLTVDKFNSIVALGQITVNGVTGYGWRLGDPTGPLSVGVNNVNATVNDGNGVISTAALTFTVATTNSSSYKLVNASRTIATGANS
jgi:hypothetical protein